MPELPEVEVTRQGLLPILQQGPITRVNIYQKQLRWPIPVQSLKLALEDSHILSIARRGKYLLFEVNSGFFLIHLGMSGHLKFLSQNKALEKHDHVEWLFQSGALLRFYDPRRFGAFLWLGQTPFMHPLLQHLGVEPLSKAFNAGYLYERCLRSKQAIKTYLMDQKIVVGVGNIYASESLFLSHIHPQKIANTLTLVECELLVINIKKVLKQAIKQGGTTLKDFSHTDGKPGYFSLKLKVYGRANQPCLICNTQIEQLRINQRNSFFCPTCQKQP